jgi:predicted AlkP superfamily phosphohydrolase/phosphomutase
MGERVSNEILIIGWDGATFSVLHPLVEQGVMPNLKALLEQGASGVLRSTIPPVTAPAWTSFITGVNPGKHGLITWQRPVDSQPMTKRWVSSRDVRAPRLWDWLPDLTVGVLNLPISYPPMQVNGFVVSGMLTPSSAKSYTYPKDLQTFVEQAADGYVLDVDLINGEWDFATEQGQLAFLDALRIACRKRVKAALALEKRYHPDLYIVVFETPDRLQHVLWRYAIGEDDFPGKSQVIERAIVACYRELDTALGALLEGMRRDTVFLISDHGFCGQHTLVCTNGWLAEKGLLAYRRGAMAVRGRLRRATRAVWGRLPQRLVRGGRAAFSADALIDWERTHAYTGFPMDHGLYVNLRGRESFGIVEPGQDYEALRHQLRDRLLKLRDERIGASIFRSVYLREEIYHGPYVDLAPDILFELTPGYKVVTTPTARLVMDDVSQAGEGFHERDGVIVVAGPDVIPGGQVNGAEIIDIAPTVMYVMGAAVPRYMDGRILTEVLSAEHLQEQPPSFIDALASKSGEAAEQAYGEEDLDLIEKRLRGLGYL